MEIGIEFPIDPEPGVRITNRLAPEAPPQSSPEALTFGGSSEEWGTARG
jgi:hypothetical protein